MVLDAVATYLTQGAAGKQVDHLLAPEKILFCCYSRLLATLWVRSERGRYTGRSIMPEHLAGSCTTLSEAFDLFITRRPSLIICTQILEEGSGLELISKIKDVDPHTPTLLFLQHGNIPIFREALKTFSDGIVLESQMGSGHVVEALRVVLEGGMYLEPEIAESLAGSHEERNPGLTERELEVIQEVVNGFNDREIGERLHMATATVKYHLKHVYSKLGVHNRTRAAISLVLMGLVAPPRPLIP